MLAPMHMLRPSVEVTFDDEPAPGGEAWPGQETTRAAAPPNAEAWPGQEVAPAAPAAPREPGALERGIGRPASIGVRNAGQGVVGLLDMLSNAGAAVGNIPGAAYDAIAGNAPGTSEPFRYGTIRRGVDAVADAAGAARPETPSERMTGAIAEGAAGTVANLPAAAAGAARVGPGVVRQVLQAMGTGAAVDAAAGATGGAAQEVAQRMGAGDVAQLGASFGGGTLGGILAQALASAIMARRGARPAGAPRAADTAPTPEEITAALGDVDLRAALEANGIAPDDPRAGMLERRLATRRAAEAARAGAPVQPDNLPNNGPGEGGMRFDRHVSAERERTAAETERAAEVPAAPPEQRPAPPAETMAVTRDGQAFPDTKGARVGQDAARGGRQLVPAGPAYDPRVGGDQGGPRAGAEPLGDEAVQRLARIEARLDELQGRRPEAMSGAEPRIAVPEGRQPQTPEQAAAQREAGGAFDLAQRQRERDSAAPATRDTQPASATSQGPERMTVYLDEGFPVRVVRDLGEGTVSVERYDPRTGAADGQPYSVQMAALRSREYTLNPRAAQDFDARAQGPVVNAGRARGQNADDALGMPRQTFRVTPDDPADAPRRSGDGEPYTPRSDRPEQAAGEAPGGGGSRAEQRYRTWEEAMADFVRRQRERADRDSASGNPGRRADSNYSERTSIKAADIDTATGRYPVDPGNNVRSDAGGAIRFGTQQQAARWILAVGQKNSRDQVFEIANHPSGGGFTAQVRGHTDPLAPPPGAPRNERERGIVELLGQAQRGDAGEGFSTRAFLEALDEDLNKSRQRFGETSDDTGTARASALRDLERELADTRAAITDMPETILAALRERDEAAATAKPDLFSETDPAPARDAERAAYEADADNPPFYASPIGDPWAWRRYVGEPLASAMRTVSEGVAGASAAAARMARAMFYSADSELRATPSARTSGAYRAELDGLYSTTGRGDGVGRTFDEAVHKGVNESLRDVQAIEDAMKAAKVSSGDLRAAIVSGRAEGAVPAALVRDTRAFLARLLKLQTDAGVDMGDAGRKYFPREFDTAAVFRSANSEARFLKAAEAEYRDPSGPALDPQGAREAAVSLLTSLKSQQQGHTIHGSTAGRGNAMNTKGREFAPAADRRLAEFYVQDTARVLGSYALRAVKRAEIARRYGEPQYTATGAVLPKLNERMAEMKAEGASAADLELLRSYVGTATGVSSPRTPPALDWLRTWATLGNLNTSLIINMSEVLMPAVRAGNMGGALKDVSQVLRQFSREIAKMPREDAGLLAERLGVIAGQGHNTIMQARFGVGDTQSRAMADIQSRFYRGIGMEQLTNATRSVAAGRGTEFIHDMSRAALGERKFLGLFGDQNRARFFLRELGVKAGGEDAFARWVKAHHEAGYPSQALGNPEGQAWQTAVGRFVDQTSLRPNAATRPRWATHPYGSILFNLSSYPYAFGKQVIGRVVNLGQEAATGKGYTPVERAALFAPVLLPLAGFAAAQVALQNARAHVTGDPEIERRKTDNRRLQDVADRSGLLGGAQPWLNVLGAGLEAARGGVVQQAAGPAAGMPLQVINTLLAMFGPGNARTNNTAERAGAKAAYRGIVEPAANLAASFLPGGGLAAGAVRGAALLSTGAPAVRDAFVDGVAGPQSARARRLARNQSIYGLADSLPWEQPTRRGVPVSGR